MCFRFRYTDPETGKSYTWDIMDQVWKEAVNDKSKKSKTKAGTKRGPSKAGKSLNGAFMLYFLFLTVWNVVLRYS